MTEFLGGYKVVENKSLILYSTNQLTLSQKLGYLHMVYTIQSNKISVKFNRKSVNYKPDSLFTAHFTFIIIAVSSYYLFVFHTWYDHVKTCLVTELEASQPVGIVVQSACSLSSSSTVHNRSGTGMAKVHMCIIIQMHLSGFSYENTTYSPQAR